MAREDGGEDPNRPGAEAAVIAGSTTTYRTEPVSALDLTDVGDRELMIRIGGGDEEAFRGLFARYAPTAKALAARVVRHPHLAEEIVQEAFLALWRHPEGFDDARGSVRSWLMGMVHHRAVDVVRREESQRRRAEASAHQAMGDQEDHADAIVDELGLPEERRRVRNALDDLPDEQRAVLTMMYFDGMSQTAIAERTGLPLGTVKSRTLLGMRRLRARLEGLER